MANTKALSAIGRWGVLLPAALIAGIGGLDKFLRPDFWQDEFVRWGYPAWMSPVAGVLELGGAVAMILPWTRFYGASLLVGVMFSAFVTRLVSGEFGPSIVPLIVVILAATTAWWSRPQWFDNMVRRN